MYINASHAKRLTVKGDGFEWGGWRAQYKPLSVENECLVANDRVPSRVPLGVLVPCHACPAKTYSSHRKKKVSTHSIMS